MLLRMLSERPAALFCWAVPLEVVEKPKRRTLDEVPLMQTYTSKEGQLFVCLQSISRGQQTYDEYNIV